MRLLLLLFLSLIFTVGFAQDLKKVTKNSRIGSLTWRDIFYVLKDQPELRHGDYTRLANGAKDIGKYDHGEKTGIWEYYNSRKEIVQRIDYNVNKVVYNKRDLIYATCWVLNEDGSEHHETDHAPAFIGGADRFYMYLNYSVRYALSAQRNNIQGKVYVAATITKEGKMIDRYIVQGLGYGLDESALKAMSAIPDEWFPPTENGEPVNVKIVIPISFTLSS